MKATKLALMVFALALIYPVASWAQNPNNFTIASFSADYYLDANSRGIGTMRVEEVIVAKFPSIDQNHGIERSLPLEYEGSDLAINVIGIFDEDGEAQPYTTYESGGQLVLRIGDPNVFVHGSTVYHINYSLENVITFYDSHDELFWDVNGTGWSQPMEKVVGRVHIPGHIQHSRQDRTVCFTGVFGSTSQQCSYDVQENPDGSHVVVFRANNLAAGENLSFVLGFDAGTFYQDPWPARKRLIGLIASVALPLGTLGFMARRWYRYGRDPQGKSIIARYTPPADLNALTSSVLLDEKLRPSALSSALIELATSRYVTIYETDKQSKGNTSYELKLIDNAAHLAKEQQKLVKSFFGDTLPDGERIKLKDKSHKLYGTSRQLTSELPATLTEQGYFRANPRSVRMHYWAIAIGMTLLLGTLGIALQVWPLLLSAPISGLIIGLFGRAMPARTKKGVAAREHLLGLKEYIQLAEAERIKYLQSPEGIRQYGEPNKTETQLKLFERLLPYAMLFGLEKQWAKQFEHLYRQPPEWLQSPNKTFNAAIFADSLHGISTSTQAAFTPPASSGSSSGSSGFSGGGSSGGGGGGGGGGGW